MTMFQRQQQCNAPASEMKWKQLLFVSFKSSWRSELHLHLQLAINIEQSSLQQVTTWQAIKLIELSFWAYFPLRVDQFSVKLELDMEEGGKEEWPSIALILLLVCFHTLITTTAATGRMIEIEVYRVPKAVPLFKHSPSCLPLSISLSLDLFLYLLPVQTSPLSAGFERISRLQFSLCGRLIIILYAHVPPLWSYYDQ